MFCEVILPLHLPSSYTYRIPQDLQGKVAVGCRVAVQFGKKKIYSGLVTELHGRVPKVQSVKYILELIDPQPIISEENLSLWRWIADYYVCYIGDVMCAALPAAFRLRSETKILVATDFTGDESLLSEEEKRILDFVALKKQTNIETLTEYLKDLKVLPLVSKMMTKQILMADEQLYDRYTPKTEDYLVYGTKCQTKEQLQEVVKDLESSKKNVKQLETLMRFASQAGSNAQIKKSDFQKDNSPSTVATLIKKNILAIERLAYSRLNDRQANASIEDIILTQEQEEAVDKITSEWNARPVSLLHGVTGSGKTEVYIKLIEQVLKEGKQVLYLLPEIALSVQLINRLEKYFGSSLGVYHSRFSKDERVEIWNKVRSEDKAKRYNVVIGSRSSIFLPFTDLGLVIVDEEHDSGFKQSEPAPRYNAKDTALYLSHTKGTKVVLGSATPSVESYFQAQTERFNYIKMSKRYADYKLPEIQIADLKQAQRTRSMYSIFSELLYENINETLRRKQQVILFKNLRGWASTIKCEVCDWTAKCNRCDVSLTVHKQTHELKCHYCGEAIPIPTECPNCHSHQLRMVGSGSEKLEEEAKRYFPQARVARLDWDSGRGKDAYQKIVDDFSEGKTDILCGTQLVSKGFDFGNVGLVGVIDADAMLAYPDFRAYERCFALLTQVSGRAGRNPQGGKVIIQTSNPYHQVFKDVYTYNYECMYNNQIVERKLFRYPPFYHLVKISLQCRDTKELDEFAQNYAKRLRQVFGGRILGPEYPPVSKVRNFFIKNIILKLECNLSYAQAKQEIRNLNEEFTASKSKNSIRIIVDVDPQ